MMISEISVMKRKNLGNYEHKEAKITAVLAEGDCVDTARELVENLVNKVLEEGKTSTKVSAQVKETVKEEVKKEEAPKEVKKEEASKQKAPAAKKKGKKAENTTTIETTREDVLEALREYAKAKSSKEMAQAVLEDVTGVKTLNEVDSKLYSKLVKSLAV